MISTNIKGIYQGDIIIRTALIEGIRRIRANPWLLDFVFASLNLDELTVQDYGQQEIVKAKRWFLKTEIPVTMDFNGDAPQTPIISIQLGESMEAESTLADINKEGPFDELDASEIVAQPQAIAGPFTPTQYNPSTGIVKVPMAVDLTGVWPGMVIVDRKAVKTYPILDVGDHEFTIDKGVVADFTNTIVAPADNLYVVSVESCNYRENYNIDLYVSGNPTELLWLDAIVRFILLRYKEELLEGRGYERSVMNTHALTGFKGDSPADGPEFIYTRRISLTGFVTHYWPKDIKGKIGHVGVDLQSTPDDEIDDPM